VETCNVPSASIVVDKFKKAKILNMLIYYKVLHVIVGKYINPKTPYKHVREAK
jgi:hypothetical protein